MKPKSFLLTMKHNPQKNGTLSVIETNRDIPFSIKRAFFIYDLKPGDVRGNHAAKYQEGLFLISGECTVILHDGKNRTEYRLTAPMDGIHIPEMYWREIRDCSLGCILAVFSDQYYDPEAYIEDFDEFLRYWEKKQ